MLAQCSSNQPGMKIACVTIGLNQVSSARPRSASLPARCSARSGRRARSARSGSWKSSVTGEAMLNASPWPARPLAEAAALQDDARGQRAGAEHDRRPGRHRELAPVGQPRLTPRARPSRMSTFSTRQSAQDAHRGRDGRAGRAAASSRAPRASCRARSRCCSSRSPMQPWMLHSTSLKSDGRHSFSPCDDAPRPGIQDLGRTAQPRPRSGTRARSANACAQARLGVESGFVLAVRASAAARAPAAGRSRPRC